MKNIWLAAGLLVVLAVGCANGNDTRPGVIVSYGNTEVVVSDIEKDPMPPINTRDATREDVLSLHTEMMCTFPEGVSGIEQQSFLSVSLQEKGINQQSFHKIEKEFMPTADFMDRLAMAMWERCPKEMANLMGPQ